MRSTAAVSRSKRVDALLELALAGAGGGAGGPSFTFVRPIDGIQDDWVRLMTVIAPANAYKNIIVMMPGLAGQKWQCQTNQVTPNGTTIVMVPGVEIVCALDPIVGTRSVPFGSGPTFSSTVLFAQNTVVGSPVIHLASDPGPVVPGVTEILVLSGNGLLAQSATIESVVHGADFAVTLDRGVLLNLSVGSGPAAQVFATRPQDITIIANNAIISGTSNARVNFVAGRNVRVEGFTGTIAGTGTLGGYIYDVGSDSCTFENMAITITPAGAGYDLAGCQDCTIIRSSCVGGNIAFRNEDSFGCELVWPTALGSSLFAIYFTGSTPQGCFQYRINGAFVDGNTLGTGIHFEAGSSKMLTEGAIVSSCQTGSNQDLTGGAPFDLQYVGCQFTFNNTGMSVANGVRGTVITNVLCDGNISNAFIIADECTINGARIVTTSTALTTAVDVQGGGNLDIKGFLLSNPAASGTGIIVRTAGTLRASGGIFRMPGGGGPIAFFGAAASFLNIEDCSSADVVIGVNGNSCTLRLGNGFNFEGGGVFSINADAGTRVNRSFAVGSVAAGPADVVIPGGGTATIPFPNFRTTDSISLVQVSGPVSTVPTVVATVGTGFTITALAASVWNWRITG